MASKLPKGCYVVNKQRGYVVYRPTVKSKPWLECDKNGNLKPPISLGKLSDGEQVLYRRYLEAVESLKENSVKLNSLSWISREFQESTQFKKLAKTTQARYITASAILKHEIEINGKPATFGDVRPEQIKRPMILRLMDKRLSTYKAKGNKGESMVNYEVRYLSSAVTWAINYVDDIGVAINPFIGVPKLSEARNDRYVTDKDYLLQLQYCEPLIRAFCEVCYLCAARQIEVRHIKKEHIHGDRLLVERRKGSRDNYIIISPRLRLALDWALDNCSKNSQWLFTNANGKQLTREGLKSSMSRIKARMKSAKQEDKFWSLHLLKHKGQTDSQDKAITGHKSEAMKALYDHSVSAHKAVN